MSTASHKFTDFWLRSDGSYHNTFMAHCITFFFWLITCTIFKCQKISPCDENEISRHVSKEITVSC